jgi:hypothetical protein
MLCYEWMNELNGGGGDGAQIFIRMLSTSLLQRSCQHVSFHAYLEILFWQDHDWATTTTTTDSDKELVKILVMDFSGKF